MHTPTVDGAARAVKFPADFIEHFWSRVDKTPGHGPRGECWLWTGAINSDGYGSLVFKGRSLSAHRVAWIIEHGETRLSVLHSCDNRQCVRPDHLFVGTQQENIEDMIAKGRMVNPRGESNGRSLITEDQVIEIRSLAASGMTKVEVSRRFNISSSAVAHIVKGQHWKHVAGPVAGPDPRFRRKLNSEMATSIRAALDAGRFQVDVAMEFGVSRTTVSRIRRRLLWK